MIEMAHRPDPQALPLSKVQCVHFTLEGDEVIRCGRNSRMRHIMQGKLPHGWLCHEHHRDVYLTYPPRPRLPQVRGAVEGIEARILKLEAEALSLAVWDSVRLTAKGHYLQWVRPGARYATKDEADAALIKVKARHPLLFCNEAPPQ